jgi:hypothetical protein
MVWTAGINGAMGFIMIVTFVMVIGDLELVLKTPTGYPFIQVFYNVTHSNTGTALMTTVLIIMLLFGCVTNFATSSRQLWAFVSSDRLFRRTRMLTCQLLPSPATKGPLYPTGYLPFDQAGTSPSTASSSPMSSPCCSPSSISAQQWR